MRVLVACEFSGIVRDAFLAEGHDAISCDLLPTESPGPHVMGDVLEILEDPWDLIIAHPPCTYLCNSGVRWLYHDCATGTATERWEKMRAATTFFWRFLENKAPRIAVENPVMHRHAGIRLPDFTIQPWQFGDPETKRTCFWTRNLPPLIPTQIVSERNAKVHRMPPGPDRARERSRFFPGIATAMAEQWGIFNKTSVV